MKVYFYASFDLILKSNNYEIILHKGNISYCENFFNETLMVCPLCDSEELKDYSFNFNKLTRYYSIFKLPSNDYLVAFYPNVNYNAENNSIKILKGQTNDIVMSYYLQNFSCFQLNIDNKKITNKFDEKIKKINFKSFNRKNNCINIVEILFSNKKYYYIILKDEIVFNGYIQDINIEDDNILILKDNITFCGQKKVIKINIENSSCEEYLVYFDNRKPFKDLSVIYLFLDYLMLSSKRAIDYLDEDLHNISQKDLLEYCGNFDDYRLIGNTCILINENKVTKTINFRINNDKIIDIFD